MAGICTYKDIRIISLCQKYISGRKSKFATDYSQLCV